MSSRARFWMMTLAVFVISCAIIMLTAYSVGADPLHPRSRHIWALSLIAAAYASIRVAMIVGRFLDTRGGDDDTASAGAGLPFFGKKEHAIDRRMAERRARVEAAQKKTEDTNEPKKDEGDE